MKRTLLVLSTLLIISTNLFSQESIGFTDSTDFKYLINYRLPEWGYSNFSIESGNLNASGSYYDQSFQRNIFGASSYSKSERTNSKEDILFSILPSYEIFRQSEQRTLSLNTSILVSSNYEKRVSDEERINYESNTVYGGDEKEQKKGVSYTLKLNNVEYYSDDHFIISNLFTDISFSRSRFDSDSYFSSNNSNTDSDNKRKIVSKDRWITFNPTLGFGFGRLRNVTPILRGIRLNERYKELGNKSLLASEIRNTAVRFTRVDGYQKTKDRFLKSFWGDMNSSLDGKLNTLDTFDIFYLNDVFNESLGSRLEGYQVSITVDYFYLNILEKREVSYYDIKSRDFSISRSTQLNLSGVWYKNLDLYHQIHLDLSNKVIFPLEREINVKWGNSIALEAGWLWNFVDRFQLNTNLTNQFNTQVIKNAPKDYIKKTESTLSTNLFYFVENKIAINGGVILTYENSKNKITDFIKDREKSFNWMLNAGIKYYFNRNLY